MLTDKQIRDKLFALPGQFREHMGGKRYSQAKRCYDTAVIIALFADVDEEDRRTLFGERGEKGAVLRRGLFPEEQVQKAYLECIKRNNTYENKKYTPFH